MQFVWACYNIFASFLLWMFCSELVLSFACVYFVITGHFLPVWGLSILRANLESTEKSAAGKVGLTLPWYHYTMGRTACSWQSDLFLCIASCHETEFSTGGALAPADLLSPAFKHCGGNIDTTTFRKTFDGAGCLYFFGKKEHQLFCCK